MAVSQFRQFINTAFEEERVRQGLDDLIDNPSFAMLFQKGDEVFGAGEDGRVVFAKFKHPDEETTEGWEKDANFMAMNLTRAVHGERINHVFEKKDAKNLKIIDRDKAFDVLKKEADEAGEKAFPAKSPVRFFDLSKLLHKSPDDAPSNFIRAREKKQ